MTNALRPHRAIAALSYLTEAERPGDDLPLPCAVRARLTCTRAADQTRAGRPELLRHPLTEEKGGTSVTRHAEAARRSALITRVSGLIASAPPSIRR